MVFNFFRYKMLKHVQISPQRSRVDMVSLQSSTSTSCASSLCGSPEPSIESYRSPSHTSSFCSLSETLPQVILWWSIQSFFQQAMGDSLLFLGSDGEVFNWILCPKKMRLRRIELKQSGWEYFRNHTKFKYHWPGQLGPLTHSYSKYEYKIWFIFD